jgi:hypothetical protein
MQQPESLKRFIKLIIQYKILLLISKQVLTSNIFVGSSNNNKSGRQNNALANARRIRQPPENVFVAL